MIFCWGHSFYCSEWKTKFHKVETGHQTFAESVVKHTANSKLKPRGRDGDSTDGVIRQFAWVDEATCAKCPMKQVRFAKQDLSKTCQMICPQCLQEAGAR